MNPIAVVREFLKKYCDRSLPILLGLSGGPDSLCLFHVLLALKQEEPLKIHIAHVNHRWREESDDEAEQIRKLADRHAIPFHLKVLDPSGMRGNLEAASRQERLNFFAEICSNTGCQAIILGHHADDQAETILKRILEGGSITRLKAMQQESLMHLTKAIKIWRPLLMVPKLTLTDWLDREAIKAFQDKTNLDPKFLRGKFRTRIIPFLNQEFGKNIRSPLCLIGKEISELCDYLDAKTEPYVKKIIASTEGYSLDLQQDCPKEPLEIRHILRRMCERANFFLSYQQIDKGIEMILSNKAHQQLATKNQKLIIDRRRLLIVALR